MNSTEYLDKLRYELTGVARKDVDEIIQDQREYIDDAIRAGRSESDVLKSLGEPKEFAANLRAELELSRFKEAKNLKDQMGGTIRAVFAIIALAPLNFLFVLGPFLFVSIMMFVFWVIAIVNSFISLIWMGYCLFQFVFLAAGFWANISSLFFAMGSIGFCVLVLIAVYQLTLLFLKGTMAYLKWNYEFVVGQRAK